MKVNEVMTKGLATFTARDTIEGLEERMADLNVHALPIVNEEGKAVGIVTSSDFTPDIPKDSALGDLMNDQVYEIDHEADAKDAAQMMRDLSVHHLVVTERGQATGMLSAFDLLRVITEGGA